MLGIDAARGMAMFFSCLAHFGWWIEFAHPGATNMLSRIGMIATPTFLLLSGTVTGWLCRKAAEHAEDIRGKLLNRGLFLLTLGHVLIALAESHRSGFVRALSGATIIDDIGVCMVCCVMWFSAIGRPDFRRSLVRYGIAGYLLCWLVILAWHPNVGGWLVLRQILLGSDPLGASMPSYTSPLLPYMCLFAIGLGASDYVVRAARTNSSPSSRTSLLILGCALMAGATILRGLLWLLEQGSGADALPLISWTLTISGKLPPTPAYVLFYGGTGLTISAVFFSMASSHGRAVRALAETVAAMGRASLFIFILQYFIFWTLPDLLGISPGNANLAIIFAAGLALNWLAAWCWNHAGGNRLLTLGIRLSKSPQGDGTVARGRSAREMMS
jgi:uncharacterized membrane protein